ncbi:MAG: gliding motility-associated protein GldE [Flavobacteriales bacterium]|nr:gliding motility-associated protein GldE [Flavobacteriales bacterium]
MDEDPQQTILIIQDIVSNGIDLNLFLASISMLFLLFCSAMISGSEVAFFSLDASKWEDEKDSTSEAQIKKMLHKPNHLLATILISNNFINVAIIILSTYMTDSLLDYNQYPILGFIIQVVVVTFALLLLGEVIPKVYANQKTLTFAKRMSGPLTILSALFKPLSQLLVSSTSIIEKRFNAKGYQISVDDLSSALDLAGENDTKEEEKRILRSIVEFGNIQVKEIMKSRVDVTALNQSTTFEEVKKVVISSGYSRIPVYKENFDTVIGVLYIKDLLPFLNHEDFNWSNLIRTPFFVPEGKMIDDLMREFQEKKIHLAIVVDEYGGTSGVVTLEDIIEEIVGDINDEFDDDGIQFSKLDNSNYIFEGKTSLNDVLKTIDGEIDFFDDIKGESDTLAGLILEMKGNIPENGEELNYEHYLFTVESVDKTRVKRVKITINEH